MLTHYIFFVFYLAALSWCADRYHKALRKVGNLQLTLKHPNAKKPIIWKELDKARLNVKKQMQKCYWILVGIYCLHQALSLTADGLFDLSSPDSHWYHIYYPIPAIIISILILRVIFWLKGQGGGIPRNMGNRLPI